MTYTFKATNNEEALPKAMRGKLMNILELTPDHGEQAALWYGKLLTAFGQPAYTTNDFEDIYTYIIEATAEDGERRVFSVYEGPTGPAIGGTEREQQAALAMIEYVKGVAPTDYEQEGYYFDGPTKIHRGVSGGEVFFSEVAVEWDAAKQAQNELSAMFRQLQDE